MTDKQRKQREEYREQEARDIEASKTKMAAKYGVKRNSKFEIAWRIAWDNGHCSGIGEVEIYFAELVELLRHD